MSASSERFGVMHESDSSVHQNAHFNATAPISLGDQHSGYIEWRPPHPAARNECPTTHDSRSSPPLFFHRDETPLLGDPPRFSQNIHFPGHHKKIERDRKENDSYHYAIEAESEMSKMLHRNQLIAKPIEKARENTNLGICPWEEQHDGFCIPRRRTEGHNEGCAHPASDASQPLLFLPVTKPRQISIYPPSQGDTPRVHALALHNNGSSSSLEANPKTWGSRRGNLFKVVEKLPSKDCKSYIKRFCVFAFHITSQCLASNVKDNHCRNSRVHIRSEIRRLYAFWKARHICTETILNELQNIIQTTCPEKDGKEILRVYDSWCKSRAGEELVQNQGNGCCVVRAARSSEMGAKLDDGVENVEVRALHRHDKSKSESFHRAAVSQGNINEEKEDAKYFSKAEPLFSRERIAANASRRKDLKVKEQLTSARNVTVQNCSLKDTTNRFSEDENLLRRSGSRQDPPNVSQQGLILARGSVKEGKNIRRLARKKAKRADSSPVPRIFSVQDTFEIDSESKAKCPSSREKFLDDKQRNENAANHTKSSHPIFKTDKNEKIRDEAHLSSSLSDILPQSRLIHKMARCARHQKIFGISQSSLFAMSQAVAVRVKDLMLRLSETSSIRKEAPRKRWSVQPAGLNLRIALDKERKVEQQNFAQASAIGIGKRPECQAQNEDTSLAIFHRPESGRRKSTFHTGLSLHRTKKQKMNGKLATQGQAEALKFLVDGISKRRRTVPINALPPISRSPKCREMSSRVKYLEHSPSTSLPRRITLHDCIFVMETEQNMRKGTLLYKWYTRALE